jgi:hypothetical protein
VHGMQRTNDWRVVHRSDAAYALADQRNDRYRFDIKYKSGFKFNKELPLRLRLVVNLRGIMHNQIL